MNETFTNARKLAQSISDGIAELPNAEVEEVAPCEYLVAEGSELYAFKTTINGRRFTVAVADEDRTL